MPTAKEIKDRLEFAPNLAYCIKQWEQMQYEWARDEHGGLVDAEMSGSERIAEYPIFQREHFSRLVGGVSKMKEPLPESAWAQRLHSTLDELPEWNALRERCRNDEYSAACATVGFSNRIIEMLPTHEENAMEARELRDLLEEDVTNGELTDLGSLQEARERLANAIAESQQTAKDLDPSALRQAARAAIGEANAELDEIDKAMDATGWGATSDYSRTKQGGKMKAKVAQKLRDNKKIASIMEMAGRMQNIWKHVKSTRPNKGATEINNIEVGNNVARLLPSESVAAMHPLMKKLLWRKLTESNAMQYRLQDKEPEGRGPIVVCVDDSSSMRGDREVWAKGLALGLLLKARDEKRAFAYCTFNTDLVITMDETATKRLNPAEILEVLEVFAGGGTNFDPPLHWAFNHIEKAEVLTKADVIFVSDGSCLCTDTKKVLDRKKALGVRIWGIAVGPDAIGQTREGSMTSFCDTVWPVNEVAPNSQNTTESAAVNGVMGV